MGYSAIKIARYVVNYCFLIKKQPISNLKLQKMLFFLWVEYYKKNTQQLFEENFYAWQFGPVIPEVYYEFCCYAGSPITKEFDDLQEENLSAINEIVDKYINFSAGELVKRTHTQDSSWYKVYDNGNGARKKIPFDLIMRVECTA